MNKIISLFIIVCWTNLYAQTPNWENAEIFEINKEPAHAWFIPFENENITDPYDLKKSSCIKVLNGNWKFHWSPNPKSRPANFYKVGFDDSKWNRIPVPANWQMHGYG